MKRRDRSDCKEAALRQKFKQINEELSPPAGLEYEILQRLENRSVSQASKIFTGMRFIITPK